MFFLREGLGPAWAGTRNAGKEGDGETWFCGHHPVESCLRGEQHPLSECYSWEEPPLTGAADTTEKTDKIILVCSVISGARLRMDAVRSPGVFLTGCRRRGVLLLPVSVFPTYRSRFEQEARILDLSMMKPPLTYVDRWLFKAPIVSAYQLPVFRYIDWLRTAHDAEHQQLWASYRDAQPVAV